MELHHEDIDWRDHSLLRLVDDHDVEALAAQSSQLIVEARIISKGISAKQR